MRTSTKVAAVIGGGALVLATAGVAFAYWTTSGSGTGTATSGNVSPVTLVQTVAPSALVPGISQPLSGTFTNPNSSPVYITSVTAVVDPDWSVGTVNPCDAGDFTVVNPTTAGVQAAVDDSTTWGGGSIVLINKSTENQDNCKGLTAIPLLLSSN